MEALRTAFPRLSLAYPSCHRSLSSTARRLRANDDMKTLFGRSPQTTTSTATRRASPTDSLTPTPRSRFEELAQSPRGRRAQLLEGARQAPQPQMQNPLLAGASSMEAADLRWEMEKQMGRRWTAGSVYAPYDLGPREAFLWKRPRRRPPRDIFAMIGDRQPGGMGDPRRHYKNMNLLAQFVHETGRIQGRDLTGLKRKNQRKLAKAVRRAVGTGLMPSTMRHPEVLAQQLGFEKWREDLGARMS